MSEIAKTISAVAEAGLWPLLHQEGFRKRANNSYRATTEALQVVTLQSSQWNHGNAGRFRINFGAHFASLAATLELPEMPAVPKEHYCVLRAIWSIPDRWWQVDSATDIASISRELAAYVRESVWTWLQNNRSLGEAAVTLERQPHGIGLWPAAAARLLVGDRDEAQRLIKECIAMSEHSLSSAPSASVDIVAAHLRKVRTWAARNDLDFHR